MSSQFDSTCVGVEVAAGEVAEHVRVSSHQLVVDPVGDVGDREPAVLFGDRGVELDLVEQVAEFLDQMLVGGWAVGSWHESASSVSRPWIASTTS